MSSRPPNPVVYYKDDRIKITRTSRAKGTNTDFKVEFLRNGKYIMLQKGDLFDLADALDDVCDDLADGINPELTSQLKQRL